MEITQEDLLNFTRKELDSIKLDTDFYGYEKLRGVVSIWNNFKKIAFISFYFDGEPTEDDKDMASEVYAYIATHLEGTMDIKYIRWDYPKPLPESPFWAYKRDVNNL